MHDPDSHCIDLIYEGVRDPNAYERAIDVLASRFRATSAVLISVDRQSPAASVFFANGVFQDALPSYTAEFAALDPAPAAFARLPIGRATTTHRLMSAEEQRGPFARDFYRPRGLVDTLGGNLFADAGRTALIGIHRSRGTPLFGDADIADMERIIPHLRRSLQLGRAFSDLNRKAAGMAAGLDNLPTGIVILDAGGRGIFVNRAMAAIARRRDGVALSRDGQLLPAGRDARRRLAELIADVQAGGSGGALSVARAGGHRPYAILASRWNESDRVPPAGKAEHGVMLLVHDPESRRDAAGLLGDCLGLTAAAAALVAALAGDDDLKSYAARTGITIHTARFHLRTALGRTGTHSQAELVRLATRLIHDLGGPG
jgi:DNA-binding CsgD family transcriptional regulator